MLRRAAVLAILLVWGIPGLAAAQAACVERDEVGICVVEGSTTGSIPQRLTEKSRRVVRGSGSAPSVATRLSVRPRSVRGATMPRRGAGSRRRSLR